MLRKYNSEIAAPDFKYSDIKYSFFECWSFTCRKQVLYLVIFDRITAHLEMNTEGNNFIDEIASYLLLNTECKQMCRPQALDFYFKEEGMHNWQDMVRDASMHIDQHKTW